MSKKYFLSLIIVISGFFLIIGFRVQAADILYKPLNCIDNVTHYDCGYTPTDQDIWVCGIIFIPGNYVCTGNGTSTPVTNCVTTEVAFKVNDCPGVISDNGENCILADPAADCWGNGIVDKKDGKWNAKDSACVQCNGKERTKLLAGSPGNKCYNYTVTSWPGCSAQWDETTSCSNTYAGKCDYGCGASYECNHQDDISGVVVSGGTCDNCVFTSSCDCNAWTDDACGPAGGCTVNQMHQTRTCQDSCAETQCMPDSSCAPPPTEDCSNGIDDDGDGCIDGADADCGGKETNFTDGIDNDCDGFTDQADPDYNPICGDGILNPVERCDPGPPVQDAACPGKCLANCTCLVIVTNPLAFGSFIELIEEIIDFIFWFGIVIAALVIVIAGFLFLTSGGDPEKIRTAKKIILYACVGLTIVLLAKGIISIIKMVIGG